MRYDLGKVLIKYFRVWVFLVKKLYNNKLIPPIINRRKLIRIGVVSSLIELIAISIVAHKKIAMIKYRYEKNNFLSTIIQIDLGIKF